MFMQNFSSLAFTQTDLDKFLPIFEENSTCQEKWKKIIADFHGLGLFMAKKHDLSEKKIPVCHAPLPLNAKFVPRLQPRP
jgi:hypothetical protein